MANILKRLDILEKYCSEEYRDLSSYLKEIEKMMKD